MKIIASAITSLFILMLANTALACDKHAVKLEAVLKAYPQVNDFKPSPYAFHSSLEDALKDIDGKKWELRYFTFFDGENKLQNMSFGEFVQKFNLTEKLELQNMSYNSYSKTFFFTQDEDLANQGIYFTLSLNPISG